MNYPTRILALDLETTGIASNYDYIVQMGAALMEGDEIISVFQSKVRPNLDKLKIAVSAMEAQCGDVTTAEGQLKVAQWIADTFSAPLAKDVAKEFSAWCSENGAGDVPVVAHNAHFDHGFMGQWIFQQRTAFKTPPLSPWWICTLTMAQKVWPGNGRFGLDECLLVAQLPSRPKDHDALQDAILAGRLYAHLANEDFSLRNVAGPFEATNAVTTNEKVSA